MTSGAALDAIQPHAARRAPLPPPPPPPLDLPPAQLALCRQERRGQSAYEREYEDDHSWEQLEEDEYGNLRAPVRTWPGSAGGAAGASLPCLVLAPQPAHLLLTRESRSRSSHALHASLHTKQLPLHPHATGPSGGAAGAAAAPAERGAERAHPARHDPLCAGACLLWLRQGCSLLAAVLHWAAETCCASCRRHPVPAANASCDFTTPCCCCAGRAGPVPSSLPCRCLGWLSCLHNQASCSPPAAWLPCAATGAALTPVLPLQLAWLCSVQRRPENVLAATCWSSVWLVSQLDWQRLALAAAFVPNAHSDLPCLLIQPPHAA